MSAKKFKIFNCKNCGKQYENKRKGTKGEGEQYCSKDCAYAHRRGIYSPNYTTKVMSPLLTLYYKPCEWCGALLHVGPRNPRRFCSREHLLLQKKRDDYQVNAQKKVLKARICLCCNKQFTPKYGNKRRLICSSVCFKKFNNLYGSTHKRRAKRFGGAYESINSLHVFQRDKWRCQLCGINTPQRLRGKRQPQSPELDHIIPLSKGGSHSYENTQCACSKCNRIKHDKPLGQLWMNGLANPNKRNKINRVGALFHERVSPC